MSTSFINIINYNLYRACEMGKMIDVKTKTDQNCSYIDEFY